ncbi:IS66 family insertion sequence element accessory protein TnpA [Tissierella creatinophila]|uniref:Transposase n=1 Tax=Tissierella creatinophila DSM 6911 TaxID=1123403 RepID=A0A1U7M7X0_TISCR|nr:hypothetical protein [Tissierella creatinophila]OLS03350.1 hypothetical protein TICRE_05800 [Tissierella creatinophila DSM 6911]
MINITTMKATNHEILKVEWMKIIESHAISGQSIRKWCEENDISRTKFYYWQRVIRQDTLIKVGTLAVTGQPQFVEIKPNESKTPSQESKSNNQGTCAILSSNGNEIEILNGVDPNTLGTVLI